ncbi:MAG: DUF6390 family protein, partial [Dehalococcoidia bacterium]
LEGVELRSLDGSLRQRFGKQLSQKMLEMGAGKAPAGAHPHHSFHVFDVHSRVGELEQSLETMDNCRISWGCVVRTAGAELVVERSPLLLIDGKLALGPARTEAMLRQVDGKGLVEQAQPGDWVSLHWGWVCEVLSDRRRANLERYTRHHLQLANQTL